MANINLPTPGQKPWNLNPAIAAMNSELNGRLSEENIDILVGEAVAQSTPVPAGILTRRSDGALVLIAPVEPAPAVPSAPSNVTVTPGVSQAAISWSAAAAPSNGPISDYQIEYKPVSASTWTVFTHTPSTGLSATITGLANSVAYVVRVAGINISGIGAYATSANFTPGAVNGVVYSDSFSRTASEIVGTTPNVGQSAYSGAVNQFQVDGSRMVGKSTATGSPVTYDMKAKGDKTIDVVARMSTEASSAVTTRRFYIAWVDTANNMYIQIGVSTAGVATITLAGNFAGTFFTFATGFPTNTIPSTTAIADYSISFTLTGTVWSLTVNGTTRPATAGSGALTTEQLAAISNATMVAYTAATTPGNVIWDNVSVSVNGTYV